MGGSLGVGVRLRVLTVELFFPLVCCGALRLMKRGVGMPPGHDISSTAKASRGLSSQELHSDLVIKQRHSRNRPEARLLLSAKAQRYLLVESSVYLNAMGPNKPSERQ